MLGRWARRATSWWKADVLFNPLRNLKYNMRNMTGDLDAIISGTGTQWIRYATKAFRDLRQHFTGSEASPELQNYLDHAGGHLMVQTVMFSDAEIAALEERAALPPDAHWAKKVKQAPVNKFVGQLNPYLKMPIELATGRSLYPDAFHSKTITNKWKHVARSVDFEWPYKFLTGKTRFDAEELSKVFLYSIDRVREFNERVLDKHFEGFASTKRGTALRNMKTAMRYKDQAAINRYLREYRELDSMPLGLKQSMKAMNLLFGMTEKEVKQFMKWITPRVADRYWRGLAGKYIIKK